MKRSLIICSIILVVAALFGWRAKRELSSEQEANARLVEEAAAVRSENSQLPEFSSLTKSRTDPRNDDPAKKAAVKALVKEYFDLYRYYDENPSVESREEFEKMKADVQKRISELAPPELNDFFDGFRNNPDLTARIKRALQSLAIDYLIQKYPIEMAGMISKSPEIFKTKPDPTYQENIRDPFFNLIFYCRNELKDTRLALQCLAAADPEYQRDYMDTVIRDADNPKERDKLLAEMREFAATADQVDIVNDNLAQLAFGQDYSKLSFKEVSDWLGSANLTTDELVGATRDMQNKVRVGETGQWLEWLAKVEMPDELSRERAFELAAEWTEKDYLAAGQCLSSAPDSPEKSAAVSAYAAKAYPYDPEGAMQWIETLPEGPDRAKALQTIYRGMQDNKIRDYDTEVVEAFAREHGLKE